MNVKSLSIKEMTIVSILGAIIFVMGWTPIGMIPLTLILSATIIHVPVIIGALVMGPKVGLILGLIMGLTSLSRAWIAPQSPLNLIFMNPIIAVLPRLFIGIAAYYSYHFVRKLLKNQILALTIASVSGSLANTILTLGTIFLIKNGQTFVLDEMSSTVSKALLGTIILTNGIPEVIVTALITVPIVLAIKKVNHIKE